MTVPMHGLKEQERQAAQTSDKASMLEQTTYNPGMLEHSQEVQSEWEPSTEEGRRLKEELDVRI